MFRNVFSGFFIFPLSIALLPVLFVPGIPVGTGLQKGMIAALLLGVTLVLVAVGLLFSRLRPAITFAPLTFATAPLVLLALLSAALSGGMGRAFFGLGVEMGTVGSFVLFAAAVAIGSFANRGHIRLWYGVYITATLAAVLLAGGLMLAGWTSAALTFFSWPQTSFALVAALVASAVLSDFAAGVRRMLYAAAAGVLSCAVLFFFHPTAVGAGAAVLAVAVLFLLGTALRTKQRYPFVALLCALFLVVLSFSGFRGFLTLPPDVRLTPVATYAVGSPVYLGTLAGGLVGSGPDTFSVAWEKNRPVQFNLTPLWNNTFREGFSTVLTWLVMIGFLGVLSGALLPVALLWNTGRALLGARRAAFSDGLLITSELLVFFVCISAAFYTIDIPLFLLGGVAFGFCARLLATTIPGTVNRPLPVRIGLSLALFVCGAGVLFVPTHQMMGAYFHGQGIAAFEGSNVSGSKSNLASSVAWWPASAYLRDDSRAVLEGVRTEASAPDASKEEIQKGIAEARRLADAAVTAAPQDFSAHFSEGSILTTLVIAGVVELGPDAMSSLKKARTLSPARPDIPYLQAVLSNALGSTTEATLYANEALQLKPDYQPALDFLKGT